MRLLEWQEADTNSPGASRWAPAACPSSQGVTAKGRRLTRPRCPLVRRNRAGRSGRTAGPTGALQGPRNQTSPARVPSKARCPALHTKTTGAPATGGSEASAAASWLPSSGGIRRGGGTARMRAGAGTAAKAPPAGNGGRGQARRMREGGGRPELAGEGGRRPNGGLT